MIISDAAIKNRTTVAVLVVLIVFAGGYSYITLPRDAMPDVPIPYVLVTTTLEGVSPEDVESSVTIKIEKELKGLDGLKEMTSTSSEGVSLITLEFDPDVDIDDALQDVRDQVDLAKPELPTDAEEPFLTEINVAEFPIMMITVSGDISPVRLKAIADELSDAIESIPGVLQANVSGALEREIRVEVDPDRLAAYDLTIPQLIALIPSENVNISAGSLETEGVKFNVRIPAEFEDPEEIEYLLLAVRNGNPIYLADVAEINDTFKDRTSYSRMNGADSVTISIRKRVGANIVFVADAAKMVLEEFRKEAPEGLDFKITLDYSEFVRRTVKDLENNILTGLVLVLTVLFLFLGFRTSTIVATAIPLSMLISFAVIQTLGYVLNMIVLFGLILALGMLVDNAIVIVENIYRHAQLGQKRIEAAIAGTKEVAWPVATSTATTVAAFSPLLFWPGMMGDFMKYLPITLIITLSSSLFVALVISPTISSLFMSKGKKERTGQRWFARGYRRLLETALEHRFATLALAMLLFVGTMKLYSIAGAGTELFPHTDPEQAYVDIRGPQGTNIRESDRLARIVEERLPPHDEHLEYVVTTVGGEGGGIFFGGGGGPHNARVTLTFYDYENRKRPSAEVVADIRKDLLDIAGGEVTVAKQQEGPPTGAAVTARIVGEDFEVLGELSEEAKRLISDVPGLVNLQSDLEATKPELAFRVDRRRAMLLGVDTSTVGRFLKTAIFGTPVGTYREFNDEYDITIRLPLSQRVNIDDLLRLQVPNNMGEPVPLSSLGEFDYKGGFGTITRVDQKRVVTLVADAEGRLGPAVLADVASRLEGLELPSGYRIEYAGEQEEMAEAMAFLTKAFIIALLLIVMILVAQFNSLVVPLIIMTTVVLSLVGVMTGLMVRRYPFGIIMTGIGIISLAGIVVNNAIVLLAYTRQLQRGGASLLNAVVEAGMTRLRPVLLTATTTILGLVPMATGVSFDFHEFNWVTRGESSQWWGNMATTVIFGLAFATVLTLVVVPTLYTTLYAAAAHFGLGGLKKPSAKDELTGELGAYP